MSEFVKQVLLLALAAAIAVAVGLLDQPLFGTQLAWYWCALVGLAIVYGGVVILVVADDV